MSVQQISIAMVSGYLARCDSFIFPPNGKGLEKTEVKRVSEKVFELSLQKSTSYAGNFRYHSINLLRDMIQS